MAEFLNFLVFYEKLLKKLLWAPYWKNFKWMGEHLQLRIKGGNREGCIDTEKKISIEEKKCIR